MRSRHIAALVIGCLIAMPGIGMLLGGAALGGIYALGRDDAGYFNSSLRTVQTSTVAATIEDVLIDIDPLSQRWVADQLDLDVRVRATPTDPQQEVFLGIAPSAEVEGYLAGTAHDRLTRVERGAQQYERADGDSEVAAPTEQDFWVEQDSGSGTRELSWELTSGRWALVIMNADGSPGVAVAATLSAHAEFLLPLAWTLIGIGLVLTVIAALLIVYAVRHRQTGPPGVAPAQVVGADRTGAVSDTGVGAPGVAGAAAGGAAGGIAGAAATPVALTSPGTPVVMTARLDPALSRGLWLIKWFLAIPHYILLGFLWAAFGVVTVIAWFAILFTGSYPRPLFDFNVGVLRWTWRVSYYSGPGGLGTDRYPAFSLDEQPDDPTTFDVIYPERLSRGLIFVKWLLAIPHLVITALLVGNGWRWSTDSDGRGWDTEWGGFGVLGLLVVIAGVILLFSGEYPRGLFDLIIGLNRWVYRVGAYVALMTDEYPPFRLDAGETERPGPPHGPPTPGPPPPASEAAPPPTDAHPPPMR
ncbi:DUF4389 domain-containing protein [Intrasporangium sp.]|uniref:DUF4389 domain-containing protein n=1 Tax=Intrasporangium sp. TaxID=1925024 RepID=UPI00293A735A|nr:DUF4389 domain-containing protein [Intrasporangium sp.]MDV3223082.1 DUF4389 domain-containing protein [Intrasporangium sp.]